MEAIHGHVVVYSPHSVSVLSDFGVSAKQKCRSLYVTFYTFLVLVLAAEKEHKLSNWENIKENTTDEK